MTDKHWLDEMDRLLKVSEVKMIVGMGVSTIYRKVADGEFPPPIRLSGGMSRWRRSDLDHWIRSLTPDVQLRKDRAE